MNNKALFLDRDGVINFDYGYVHLKKNFDFIDGIFDLTRRAFNKHYKIVVITNQSGIGRGLYSEKLFLELTDWMCNRFKQEGAKIDKVYYCSSHPTHGLGSHKKVDPRRKPGAGMFVEARNELRIDMEASVLIGDKISDIEAGQLAGVGKRFLLKPNNEQEIDAINLFTQISNLKDAMMYL